MIPWLYHRLTPRDQAGDLLRVQNFKGERTGPDTVITYTVPAEKILLVTMMNWYYSDAAGFTTQPWMLTITEDTTTVFSAPMVRDVTQGITVPAAATVSSKTLRGSPLLIVPPLNVIQSTIFGGTAAAQHIWTFNGILLPHGTFSTGSVPFG